MIYDIRQFRFGDSDVTKIRLSAVFNANEFIREEYCSSIVYMLSR